MAIRKIRTGDDPVLREQAVPVKNVTAKVQEILDDMVDTMLDANGLGLAAPQVGIKKRLVVLNLSPILEENEEEESAREQSPRFLYLVNPTIQEVEGESIQVEGCLSFPGVYGEVPRPEKVVVTALDREGKPIKVTGRGILARALCHETDHLNGVLFVDKVTRFVDPKEDEEKTIVEGKD